MRISALLIFTILCLGVFVSAQEPAYVLPNVENIGHVRADCPDMLAGSARMVSTTDGEALVDVEDIVLCYGDGVIVNHNGDYNVSQDPEGSTPAGIWYAVFTSEPTTTGVIDETALAGLQDIVRLDDGPLVFARANDANGNMTIINDGSFLEAAELSAPVQLWFAPITMHNINGATPEEYFENADACIHLNSESAFTVTYLNELTFMLPNPGATTGTIMVMGGFPELDGSEYSATMTDLSTNEVIQLTSDNNTEFSYSVPDSDHSYRITVSDKNGTGCSSSRIINFRSGVPLEVHIPDTTASPGSEICIPLTVKDFRDIGTFSFVMRWNPAVIDFASINYENPVLSVGGNDLTENSDHTDQGNLIALWFANNLIPVEIPDDSVLMEVCFTVVGNPGQRTDVTLGSYNGTLIDFTTTSEPVNFSIFDGSVTVVPASDLDFSFSACGSNNSFILNVQVFGGRGPYSYQLTGESTEDGTGTTDQITLNDLPGGNYSLEITDASGAMVTKNITIMSADENYGISSMGNYCSSDPNGLAYITNPPSGNYQIEWTYNNETYYNTDTLKNLAGGEVSFRIVDENNCPSPVRTVTIQNQGVRAEATVLEGPNCDGTPGTVRINISGGTPDYTIYHSGNSYTAGNENIDLDVLYREIESFNITDAMGCAFPLVVTSTVSGGETFTLTDSVVTHINCDNQHENRGQFSGIITNSSGGTFSDADLYYADGSPVHGTSYIPNPANGSIRARYLEEGDYYWEIEGSCAGATTRIEFTIQNLVTNPPTIDPTITAIGCDSMASGGAISLEIIPARDNYIFEWSNGATTADISDLEAGEYTVTVTDPETTCSIMETFTISEGVTYTKIETSLPCDADTTVDVGVSIRDDYESILWDSGETTEIISVNAPGYYGFTITLADSMCGTISDSIYVSSATGGVEITGLNQVLVDGCGDPEGIVVVYLSEPIDNFGFSWDNGSTTLGQNEFRVFDANQHNLKIYQDDCIAIDTSFTFVFPNIITIDSTSFDVTCYGEDDGQISVNASGGGSNNFRYEFNNSGREDFFLEYTNLAPGDYTVRIIDQTPPAASPCPDVNITFTINEPEPFTVEVDTTQVIPPSCSGDADGSLMLVMMGGNPGTKDIRYTYSGGAGRTTELMLDSLRASRYDIRVQDSMGCTANTTYTLEDPSPVNFTIPPIEEPACAGYTTTLIINNASGGTGADYQYSVDGGVPVPLGEPLDILAGDHDITVFDGNLCNVTNVVTIREPAPIIVNFNQPDTIQVSLGENLEIAAEINGTNPITDYIWTPGPPDSLNIDNILAFTAVDNVTINLEVIDSRGCTGTSQIFVLVRKRRDVGIPNAFTPNGDGHNDLLTIIPGPSVRSIKMFQVYDRYGTLMYEQSDISPANAQITGWDGTYSGKPAMFDVYVTLVQVEYIDGQVIQRISDVTLMK